MVGNNWCGWRHWVILSAGALAGCQSSIPESDVQVSKASQSTKAAIDEKVTSSDRVTSGAARLPLMAPSAQPLMVPALNQAPQKPEVVDPHLVAEVEELFEKLTSPGTSPEDWEQTHTKILALEDKAAPTLATMLGSESVFRRETAASLLVLLGPNAKQAKSLLVKALQDTSPFVQANAAVALVTIGEHQRQACEVLVKSLQSRDVQLRQMAAMNLSALGEEAKGFVSDLTFVLAEETSHEVLVPVVQLLGRLGPEATDAVPRLKQIAFEQDGPLKAEASAAINSIQQASLTEPASAAPNLAFPQ